MILNKDEYIEAGSHLDKIEQAIANKDEFRLARLITQLKYKYDLRLEVVKGDTIVSTSEPEVSL